MYLFNYYNFKKISVLNFLISIIPLSLILGNFITNLNLLLICLVGLLNFGKNVFFIEKKIYQYLIYLFFFFLIFTTLLNNLKLIDSNEIYKENIYKSLYYLRFLLLFLIITKLIDEDKFNAKLFFISSAFFSLLTGIDIFFQFFFKFNLIGLPSSQEGRLSGFFGNELISGGYLQKFLLFFIFYMVITKKIKKNINSFFLISFFISFFCIFLTGNKMPTIIFFLITILFFVMEKKFKEIIIISILSTAIIFFLINNPSNIKIKSNIYSMLQESKYILSTGPRLFLKDKLDKNYTWNTGYLIHFYSGIKIWEQKKIIGNGLKSFRIKCTYDNFQTCNTHPHNYFIEILVDMGLIGIILIYAIFFIGLANFFKLYFLNKNKPIKFISYVFFLLIFFEFFPIRSTGSFFTTNNSIFIFSIFAIFLNVEKIKKL